MVSDWEIDVKLIAAAEGDVYAWRCGAWLNRVASWWHYKKILTSLSSTYLKNFIPLGPPKMLANLVFVGVAVRCTDSLNWW